MAAAPYPLPTNDTFLPRQWYLDAIQAPDGWGYSTGSTDVVVAVIDTAVDIDHPDIRPNIWTNPSEIPDNGRDDDGDGHIDDVHGWDFLAGSGDLKPKASEDAQRDPFIHGTAVASLIAGAGDNDIGIAGVAWRARIMPLVALDDDGYGRDREVMAAIRYAVAHGADIINLSFMGGDQDQDLAKAIREATAQGVLVVSAAGNGETASGDDLDALPSYPACDKGAAGRGALTVTGMSADGQKAPYADYGSCVDVSAPGADIFAARPTYDHLTGMPAAGYVGGLSGTSVAAPLVSGLAVLLKARHPYWGAAEIAQRILDAADPLPDLPPWLEGKMGKGRINVARALGDDEASIRLGPLFLEASGPGRPPEVRVVDRYNREISRFPVGESGDMRGLRAAFVRWSGSLEPEIAIAPRDDTSGSWRVYRQDGVLLAAGEAGHGVAGGLYLAAQDLESRGRDTLFLGEAAGRRAWLVSASAPAQELALFGADPAQGTVALSVNRPVMSFLAAAKASGAVEVIGSAGESLASNPANGHPGSDWQARRGLSRSFEPVYVVSSGDSRMVFIPDSGGLSMAEGGVAIERWVQLPDGEPQADGWRYHEAWPR